MNGAKAESTSGTAAQMQSICANETYETINGIPLGAATKMLFLSDSETSEEILGSHWGVSSCLFTTPLSPRQNAPEEVSAVKVDTYSPWFANSSCGG